MPLFLIPLLSFLFGLIDSSLGMGYGTTLTPILLLLGFEPLAVVPAVLLSQLFSGSAAAFVHHKFGNVKFDFKNDPDSNTRRRIGKLSYIPKSRDAKVAFLLGLCGLIGGTVSVFVAISLPQKTLKTYIGILVLIMGIYIFRNAKRKFKFSWKKLAGLGIVASFNKGVSGGGYGPLVCGGQILSGVNSKNAIAITTLSESIVSLVGVSLYFILKPDLNWQLAPYLVVGALLSVPLSGLIVKKMKTGKLTFIIGTATILLGAFTLFKIYF